jgi:hypothetical protein
MNVGKKTNQSTSSKSTDLVQKINEGTENVKRQSLLDFFLHFVNVNVGVFQFYITLFLFDCILARIQVNDVVFTTQYVRDGGEM